MAGVNASKRLILGVGNHQTELKELALRFGILAGVFRRRKDFEAHASKKGASRLFLLSVTRPGQINFDPRWLCDLRSREVCLYRFSSNYQWRAKPPYYPTYAFEWSHVKEKFQRDANAGYY